MKIEVKNLLNQPPGEVENHRLDLANLIIDDITAKVIGQVTLTNLNDFILAQVSGTAEFTQPCSRCLKDVILTIPLDFSREFSKKDSDRPSQGIIKQNNEFGPSVDENEREVPEDEDNCPIIDGKIDLTTALTEEIVANIPLRILCKKDCLGLCPQCGNNLNDNPCKCDKVEFEATNKINL